ncbi:phage terminase small subunit [Clostridium botulinum]|uniref:phage terminase small subunit n=1 Tax=Clostridium botulinum TaxID=1491 RepID=UPI0019680BE6|nr:phage terminase small subunit [Clostridium botulinum]
MKGDGGMAGAPKGNKNAVGNKGGAPKGNKNAIGNNGGAPKGNLNNLQHGNYYDPTKHLEKDFLKKYIPTATKNIIKETAESGISSLEMLWANIQIQFAAIIRSQKIMFVKSKNEMIKELKKEKAYESDDCSSNEKEYEFQFAWDRQATFLNSQSKAMATLQNMITKYEELLHKNWDLVTEEQKVRVDMLKAQIKELNDDDKDLNNNSTKKLDSILNQIKVRRKNE